MSKFTKVYKKWHAENNGKYDSAREYHKALMGNFKGWKPPKPFVVVPEFVAEYIERCKSYGCGLIWAIRPDRDANDNSEEVYDWLFPNGYRLEDGSFPDPFEPDNLVRPDSGNQLKFARAWIDGYTVEK